MCFFCWIKKVSKTVGGTVDRRSSETVTCRKMCAKSADHHFESSSISTNVMSDDLTPTVEDHTGYSDDEFEPLTPNDNHSLENSLEDYHHDQNFEHDSMEAFADEFVHADLTVTEESDDGEGDEVTGLRYDYDDYDDETDVVLTKLVKKYRRKRNRTKRTHGYRYPQYPHGTNSDSSVDPEVLDIDQLEQELLQFINSSEQQHPLSQL